VCIHRDVKPRNLSKFTMVLLVFQIISIPFSSVRFAGNYAQLSFSSPR